MTPQEKAGIIKHRLRYMLVDRYRPPRSLAYKLTIAGMIVGALVFGFLLGMEYAAHATACV